MKGSKKHYLEISDNNIAKLTKEQLTQIVERVIGWGGGDIWVVCPNDKIDIIRSDTWEYNEKEIAVINEDSKEFYHWDLPIKENK